MQGGGGGVSESPAFSSPFSRGREVALQLDITSCCRNNLWVSQGEVEALMRTHCWQDSFRIMTELQPIINRRICEMFLLCYDQNPVRGSWNSWARAPALHASRRFQGQSLAASPGSAGKRPFLKTFESPCQSLEAKLIFENWMTSVRIRQLHMLLFSIAFNSHIGRVSKAACVALLFKV